MKHNYSHIDQSGIALVNVLLYLLVVTLLVTCAFSDSLLQTKISAHFNQETQSFERAESALSEGENNINSAQEKGEGHIMNATYSFHKILTPNNNCGLFYQVDSIATIMAAKTHLQSIFTFPKAQPTPCEDLVSDHRVIWRQIKE